MNKHCSFIGTNSVVNKHTSREEGELCASGSRRVEESKCIKGMLNGFVGLLLRTKGWFQLRRDWKGGQDQEVKGIFRPRVAH